MISCADGASSCSFWPVSAQLGDYAHCRIRAFEVRGHHGDESPVADYRAGFGLIAICRPFILGIAACSLSVLFQNGASSSTSRLGLVGRGGGWGFVAASTGAERVLGKTRIEKGGAPTDPRSFRGDLVSAAFLTSAVATAAKRWPMEW